MTLQFSIEYRTEWGQSVEVELCFLTAEGKTRWQRIPLETDDGYLWKGIAMLRSQGNQLRYTYIVTNNSAVIRREWNVVPRVFPSDDAHTYFFVDHWRDRPESSYCYSDAYRVASGLDDKIATPVALYPRTYLFRVQTPQLAPGEKVALVGDQPTLGNWDCERALPMIQTRQQEWTISISGDGLRLPFQYKYVVQDENHSVRWEEGPNRQSPSNNDQVSIVNSQSSIVVALSDGEIRLEAPHWKVAGLVVPLFSLRTEDSQGVGDFGDLKDIVSWAASTGMHAVQLLPIYDTTQERTHTDSYPYNAISVHAIHPLYIDLRQLPLADANKLEAFKVRWQDLNALPALDYVEAIKLKEDYLHLLYEEQMHAVCQKDDYRAFVDNNAEWLQPYSVFCHLRDTYGTSCFSDWPVLSSYNRSAVMSYFEQHAVEVGYYMFVQYLLHIQLSEASDFARRLRVFLKGDLPIGISPCSVEAWQEPHLFHTDMAAGAPPDDFSRTGQNWGFPTYDWEQMAADDYLWWRKRLSGMSRYFSAYRIDHILGFFRIWQIPQGSPSALYGQFSPALPMTTEEIESYGLGFREELFLPDATQPDRYHPRMGVIGEPIWLSLPSNEQDAFIRLYDDFYFRRHDYYWAEQAMKKLPALIGASNMLVCGEDLGMVPGCVGPVMQQLGILSLEIQTMPKTYGVAFAQFHQNPYRSVATIFTHDMPTLRLWWKENPERTQLYYNTVLEHDGKAPNELPGWLCEEIVAHHLNSPSMLCLISLQDWLSIDDDLRNPSAEEERINVPANPRHYWRYRMHLSVADLKNSKLLNERIGTLISHSGRS